MIGLGLMNKQRAEKLRGGGILSIVCLFSSISMFLSIMEDVPNLSDLDSTTGTLSSVEAYVNTTKWTRTAGLHLFIKESNVRFRVDAVSASSCFNKDSFFENVKIGNKITLTASKDMFAVPKKIKGIDTISLIGLKDESHTYIDPTNLIDWKKDDNFWLSVVAIIVFVLGFLATLSFIRALLKKD